MRVLFVGSPSARPTDGGSATFHRTVLAALQLARTSHDLFYIQAVAGARVVQQSVVANRIDFVWFMSPYHEDVEVPFAATVWDLSHREAPYFPELSLSGWTFEARESFYRHVLPRASIVVIGNSTGARHVNAFYQIPYENICTIPLPIDLADVGERVADSAVIERFGLRPAEYLFYPAQFWPHKNHITLIDTLLNLRNSGTNFKLLLSGSDKGNRSHVENHVDRCNLRDSVVFAGFVETHELHQFYLNAFAMVFASLLGPDNLPPLEAMAHGCPVISANFDGALEQMGEAALFFDGLDSHQAASQVMSLVDPVVKDRLVQNGHALVQTRSKEEYIKRISGALDRFASIRRLWGPSNSYHHL
jgi:glycosyltransferase involved in cell wall biosynthesis